MLLSRGDPDSDMFERGNNPLTEQRAGNMQLTEQMGVQGATLVSCVFYSGTVCSVSGVIRPAVNKSLPMTSSACLNYKNSKFLDSRGCVAPFLYKM